MLGGGQGRSSPQTDLDEVGRHSVAVEAGKVVAVYGSVHENQADSSDFSANVVQSELVAFTRPRTHFGFKPAILIANGPEVANMDLRD